MTLRLLFLVLSVVLTDTKASENRASGRPPIHHHQQQKTPQALSPKKIKRRGKIKSCLCPPRH
ncbi:hypothetical protein [Candidatus Hamiltonella defensa]|uniref:hypothetical protein n=1 Tax=Candidatus Williamhamiltonella defendens TaxID=138072 RepID=UPI0020C5CA60|nr:hypothetical protein [Candidatus Hamiltonella defensa]